jgi:hypothetical protein
MTVSAAQFAIALVLTSSMVIATSHHSVAAPGCTPNGGAGCFKKGAAPHTVRKYYNYAPHGKKPHHDPFDDPQVKAIWEEAIGQ